MTTITEMRDEEKICIYHVQNEYVTSNFKNASSPQANTMLSITALDHRY